MIVMKFGGTSLESAAAIERVASIVRTHLERRPLVVVSAMGKTTGALLAIGAEAADGKREQALARLCELQNYHRRESEGLVESGDREELEAILSQHFHELAELARGLAALGELTPRSMDAIASYGERISSRIVTLAFRKWGIPSTHLDARQLIVTDRRHTQAAPVFPLTNARLAAAISSLGPDKLAVMGGFIGASDEGLTTTLGRGGSDTSAVAVAAAIRADRIALIGPPREALRSSAGCVCGPDSGGGRGLTWSKLSSENCS